MIAECGTSERGYRRYYYKYHGRKNLCNGCKQTAYRKEILEKLVLDSIIEELKKPHQIEFITKELLAIQESQVKMSSTLAMLEKEQRQNARRLKILFPSLNKAFTP